jgi:hypothetical protein
VALVTPVLASRMLQSLGLFIRRRRHTILITVAAAVATLILMAGSVVAWSAYAEWRMGRVELTTDGAPLVCQVIAESSDSPIGDPFDLVSRAVVTLPAGDYRLLASGTGRLSRTYRFAVNRGETQAHRIALDEGRLLGGERMTEIGNGKLPREIPIPFAPMTRPLERSPGKSDFVERSRESLICRDAATGNVIWNTAHPEKPFAQGRNPALWMKNVSATARTSELLRPAPDLDGDGTGDLLWSIQSSAAFLAISGKNGSMLWNYVADLDGPGGPKADGPANFSQQDPRARANWTIGTPILADVDRDGLPDLIATCIFCETREETERRPVAESAGKPAETKVPFYRRLVMAVSGRSGRQLWKFAIDPTFQSAWQEAWRQPPALLHGRQSTLLSVVDGARWLGLDPATGQPRAGPFDLEAIAIREVQYCDLDGDGEPELVALGLGPAGGPREVRAFSIKTGHALWTETAGSDYDQSENGGPRPGFPLPVDLDGDGRSEIVVSDQGPMPPLSGYRGVKLIDGSSGKPRWHRPMIPDTKAGDGVTEIIAAPDLDGDGTRDLVTISLVAGKNPPRSQTPPADPERVYVDALSGKDGQALWWWSVDLPAEKFTRIWKPLWWGRGPDGWPLLAVPLGGAHPDGVEGNLGSERLLPPTVHLLEASTGKERHSVNGLTRAAIADFNGDGLTDLWGEVDGELRAFRGEAPEAWRVLGGSYASGSRQSNVAFVGNSTVDFDGDGIADTWTDNVRAPGASALETTGSHTALTRSGRDGHVIWKAVLDPRETWFEPDRGESYGLIAFPLPVGDLNGDGTPDVIVQKYAQTAGSTARGAATLPLQVLSGRTGRVLWRAGPLPLGFEAQGYSSITSIEAQAIEPGKPPDLVVHHGNPFVKPGSPPAPPGPGSPYRPSLARVSGRDGRILWDITLAESAAPQMFRYVPGPHFVDVNGDGALDILLFAPPIASAGQPEYRLVAISLADGKQLWSQPLRSELDLAGDIQIGDLDGDSRPDIVLMDQLFKADVLELEVRALSGHDGKTRWTWNSGPVFQGNLPSRLITLANLDVAGKQSVCLNFKEPGGTRRILVLDGAGKERAHRDVAGDYASILNAVDSNGDGRDEILASYGERICALQSDLKEAWSWPNPFISVERILPPSQGQRCMVLISPALALDGATGTPRWTGQAPLIYWPPSIVPRLLDPGNAARPPLLISNGMAATFCRVAMPTTPDGKLAPPRGTPVQPGRIRDDPRWTRPLPWLIWLKGIFGPWGFLAAAGLALVNVALPLSIVRLLAGRRRFSIRALMALPVAAAIPLMCLLVLEPVLPANSAPFLTSERRLFTAGTLAGLPIVYCVLWTAKRVARLRWKTVCAIAALIVIASLAIAAVWLRFDVRSKAAIEHYSLTGWYLVALPGAYVAAVVCLLIRAVVAIYEFVRHRVRRAGAHDFPGNLGRTPTSSS